MVVDSLQTIAAKSVADFIHIEKFRNVDLKLNPRVSNLVYEYTRTNKKLSFTETTTKEILKRLNITEMTIDTEHMLVDYFDIAIAQNLTKLNLKYLYQMSGVRDDDGKINVGTILEKSLNSQSQEILKEIRINGSYATLSNNWVDEVYKFIPSVAKLHLPSCTMNPSNFISLCQFKNVTELDISYSAVNNLTGISNITNLELLNLSNLEFREKEDVMDLFNLEQLRVLNMSSFLYEDFFSQNLKLYLQCEKSLPQLRFLDCSNNDIDLKDLSVLVETHPMLEVVCLLETPLEKCPQIEFPGRTIELLTTENAHCCLRSLNYCMQTIEYKGDVKRIFNECAEFLENLNTSDQDYKDCMRLMLFFIKKYKDSKTYQEYALDCLQYACLKANLLDINEKHHLIRTILDSLSDYPPYENDDDDDPISVVYYNAFNILSRNEIFEASPQAIDAVCKGISDVFRFANFVRPGTTPYCCLLILKEVARRITSPDALDVAELKLPLLQIARKYDIHENGVETFILLLNVIYDLTYINREFCAEELALVSDTAVIHLIIATMANLDDDSQKRDVLNILGGYVKHVNVLVFESLFHRFEEIMMSSLLAKNSEEQKAAVSALGSMMCCEDQQATPFTEQTLNAILQSLNSFEATGYTHPMRCIVQTSDNREAVNWAKWFLRKCGGVAEEEGAWVEMVPEEIVPEEAREEEPEAKRRRV
ncbi:hypothetical protein GCK72_003709 [Caenorhabditis remanei]|uniref:Uncharacterized protein n=1 Tax=Caenorhabditis remanei TaxID=31234 RepID=A0A6A5HAA8_CAERE|nr:hypothetical protein GCK72_003709 [Caenorhabditis remanei]KAF1763764.1 hypothetical protein GCK72_003709 [Caenorhabditis remanei]